VCDLKGEGIYGASAVILDTEGKSTYVGAATDFDGHFSIPIEDIFPSLQRLAIQINAFGYLSQVLIITPSTPVNIPFQITLRESSTTISMGLFVAPYHKPSLKIRTKNWFRNLLGMPEKRHAKIITKQ
jgi:hypothetical protein